MLCTFLPPLACDEGLSGAGEAAPEPRAAIFNKSTANDGGRWARFWAISMVGVSRSYYSVFSSATHLGLSIGVHYVKPVQQPGVRSMPDVCCMFIAHCSYHVRAQSGKSSSWAGSASSCVCACAESGGVGAAGSVCDAAGAAAAVGGASNALTVPG